MAPKEITGIRSQPVDKRGGWIATSSGEMHSVKSPSPKDLKISDVAAGLARECRYNSQIRIDRPFLSCAEHNVTLLKVALREGVVKDSQDAFAVLMSGAVKAYLRDMAKPMTVALPDYRHLRDVHEKTIEEAFMCAPSPELRQWIRATSERIRLDERQCLLLDPAKSEGLLDSQVEAGQDVSPVFVEFDFLQPHEAMRSFLSEITMIYSIIDEPKNAAEFNHLFPDLVSDAEQALKMIPASDDRYNMGHDILEGFEETWLAEVGARRTRLGFEEWVSQRPEWTSASRMTFTVDVVKNGQSERFYLVSPDDSDTPSVQSLEEKFRNLTGIDDGTAFFCRTSRFDLYEMGQEGFAISFAEEPVVMRALEGGRIEVVEAENGPDGP